MKSDSMLELRVLTGTHAGARALLAAEPQFIGSGDDCALILTDDGVMAQHACIEQGADGSIVLKWQEADLAPSILQPGESACVGPVRIAVVPCDAPWREDLPLASPPAPRTAAAERTSGQAPLSPRNTGGSRTFAGLAGVAALIAALPLAWPLAHSVRTHAADELPSPLPATASSDEPLAHLIARLGLEGRTRVDFSNAQHPVVKAAFLSEQEIEALANELSRRSPRPHLELIEEAEAVAQVVQGVQRMSDLSGTQVTARHLGAGQFRIEGHAADEGQRSQLVADIRDAFAQVSGFEVEIKIRAESARAMVEDLKREAVGQLTTRWADGILTLEAIVPAGGLPAWERALVAAASRHDVPFRATVKSTEVAGGKVPSQLPFTVRSVVSGPTPYVVLADGLKLATGGEVQGWRLVHVDPRNARFEGPTANQFTLER